MRVIICATVGGVIGLVSGVWLGAREGGDYNFAPIIYGPAGAALGCWLGAIAGATFLAS